MPYINLKTTAKVTEEKCERVKTAFGKAIECFPGKSEAYLMVGIEDGAKLMGSGDQYVHAFLPFCSASRYSLPTFSACHLRTMR